MRPSIETGSHVTCPHCQGRGLVKTPENASLGFLRQAAHTLSKGGLGGIKARLNPDVAHYLLNYKRLDISRLEERYEARVIVTGDPTLSPGLVEMESFKKSAEAEILKPGQVAGLFEDDVQADGLDFDQPYHRHDAYRESGYAGSKHSHSHANQSGASSQNHSAGHNHTANQNHASSQSAASSQNHASGSQSGASQSSSGQSGSNQSGSGQPDSKGGRSRRSGRRGTRPDFAKNSDSEAALAF